MRTGRRILIIIIILLISIIFNFNLIVIGDNSIEPQRSSNFGTRGINTTGDWQITNTTTISDDTIILDGNLSIEPGGNLTLRNVILKLNCTTNGTYHIEVKSGGTLHIDDSNITVNNPEYRSYWNVQKGSKFTLNNTEVSNFGWNETYLGLEIETNNVLIENCTFFNCHVAVAFIRSESGQVINSNFVNNFYSIYTENSMWNEIRGCEISDGISGIVLVNSSENYILKCQISSHKDPGIFIYNSDNTFVLNCTIMFHTYSYYDFKAKGIFIKNSENNGIINSKLISNSNGIYIENSYGNLIFNCELTDNIDSGINIYFSAWNGVYESTMKNNSHGITLWSGNDCRIENCTISDNKKAGANFMNANDNIFEECIFNDNRDGAFFNGVSKDNEFINCTLENTLSYDLNLTFKANVILINTTIQIIRWADSGSNYTFNWFLNIQVIDASGNIIPNVTARIYNRFNELVFNKTLNSRGQLNWLILPEVLEGEEPNHFSPYVVMINNDTYKNETKIELNRSLNLIIILEETFKPPSGGDKDDDEQFFTEDLCICVSVFIIIFMAILLINSYLMKRKYAKSGPPGIGGGIPMDKVKCSECDALVPADASSCPRCGEPFEGEEFECPGCGATLTEDSTECKKCGKQFQVSSKLELEDDEDHSKKAASGKFYCSDCGGVIDENDSFCPACGELFEDESEPKKLKPRKKLKKGKAIDQEFMCSVCGAQVSGGASRCPKCKTEFD